MRQFLIVVMSLGSLVSFSQVNTATWGVQDTIIVIDKTTDFGPVHDYIEVFNNSGQDLDMRWICHEPVTWPALWETNFTDCSQSNYSDVQDLDSADFLITNPIGFQNKMIIGVQHNSYAHTDTLVFEVFPVDYPQDVLYLHYVIIIAQGSAWASLDSETFPEWYSYDPASNQITLNGVKDGDLLNVFDMNGKLLLSENVNNSESFDLNAFAGQLVILQSTSENGEVLRSKCFLH